MGQKKQKKQTKKKNPAIKLTLDRTEFQNTLKVALDFIEKRATMPILQHIRLDSDGKTCTISATDLEVAWTKAIPSKGSKVSKCIPADILHKEIKALQPDITQVVLTFKENTVDVNGRCEIFTQSIDEYPGIRTLRDSDVYTVDSLTEKLKRVILAVSNEEYRHNITGICLDFQKGKIVATDGHRLHYEDIALLKDTPILLIPKKAATLAIKHGSSDNIRSKDDHISIDIAGGEMVARLVDADFPDYPEIISGVKDNQIKVEFQADDFLKILDGAIPLAHHNKGISLTVNGSMVIKTQNPDIGNYQWQIPCKTKGKGKKELTVFFNARYLVDAIKSYAEDGKVTMEIKETIAPCLINKKALVMPIRAI